MRRFSRLVFAISVVLIALAVLAGCLNNAADSSQSGAGGSGSSAPSSESDLPDFYDELNSRNSRIVAEFDLDEFSVWFAITPVQDSNNQNRWDFANGGNMGIPLTVAVVKNSEGRYSLVEELAANLDLRPVEWSFTEMPKRLPTLQNHHLKSGDGYLFTNFFDTGVFDGYEGLRRQALVVLAEGTLSLLYQSPMDALSASGEHLGGVLFGMEADNSMLRHIVIGKEGVIADSTIVTKGDYKGHFYTLGEFAFAPQTKTITLGRLTAGPGGITEAPYETKFDVLAGGEVVCVDNILRLSARTLTEAPQGSSITTGAQYPVIGSSIYRLPFTALEHVSQLKYDSFNLLTHTGVTEQLLHDFGSETVTDYTQTEAGLMVHTDAAAYFFDDAFKITQRIPWPADTGSGIFNDDFTLMAFRGEAGGAKGIYLLNLATGGPPTLLLADITWDRSSSEPYGEGQFPIRFIDNNRIFIGVSVWESTFFRIIDTAGNVLEEFPFHASGMHSGGYNYSNSAMAIFLPMQREQGPHYYDFNSGELHPADWWEEDELQYRNCYVPDPANPYIWYVGVTYYDSPEYPKKALGSGILRLDFANKTVKTLISATGTRTTLLSAGRGGELVFAFASDMDSGFVVFTPQSGQGT